MTSQARTRIYARAGEPHSHLLCATSTLRTDIEGRAPGNGARSDFTRLSESRRLRLRHRSDRILDGQHGLSFVVRMECVPHLRGKPVNPSCPLCLAEESGVGGYAGIETENLKKIRLMYTRLQ